MCLKDGKKAQCSCEKGFQLLPDKMTCEEIHPCDKKSKGGCTHICLKKGDEAVCGCPKNMELDEDGKTCNIGKCCIQLRKRTLDLRGGTPPRSTASTSESIHALNENIVL